jgi:hypothetical protein
MELNEVLKQIKPWVKTYSAEIPLKYKHGDTVCVGGMVESVFDLSMVFDDFKGYVEIKVDDDIGKMTLLVPLEVYQEIQKEYEFKKDMIILAEGRVVVKPIQSETPREEAPRVEVICWNVYPLSSKKDKEEEG